MNIPDSEIPDSRTFYFLMLLVQFYICVYKLDIQPDNVMLIHNISYVIG
jgi:hypothetical protein